MKELNIAEVEAFFAAEAVPMRTQNGLPISKARETFGNDAVEFAQRISYRAYLTFTETLMAASYSNNKAFREAE